MLRRVKLGVGFDVKTNYQTVTVENVKMLLEFSKRSLFAGLRKKITLDQPITAVGRVHFCIDGLFFCTILGSCSNVW